MCFTAWLFELSHFNGDLSFSYWINYILLELQEHYQLTCSTCKLDVQLYVTDLRKKKEEAYLSLIYIWANIALSSDQDPDTIYLVVLPSVRCCIEWSQKPHTRSTFQSKRRRREKEGKIYPTVFAHIPLDISQKRRFENVFFFTIYV